MKRLLQTYSFRITLLYVALFSVSVLVIFGVIYWATSGSMTGGLELSVEAEMSSLLGVRESGRAGALAAAVSERSGGPNHRSTYILLQDASGKWLAGNLPALPATVGWQDLPLPTGEEA